MTKKSVYVAQGLFGYPVNYYSGKKLIQVGKNRVSKYQGQSITHKQFKTKSEAISFAKNYAKKSKTPFGGYID